MKRIPHPALVALVVVLGVVVTDAVAIYTSLASGIPSIDALRPYIVFALLTKGLTLGIVSPTDQVAAGRGLMMVANAENSTGRVGDTGIGSGPSISPWQILRTTAIAKGYVPSGTTAEDYAAIDTGSVWGRYVWACHALDYWQTECWSRAPGDYVSALAIWNGGPGGAQNANPQAYAQGGAYGTPTDGVVGPAGTPPSDWLPS